ncbi:hypothetical protein VPH35_025701 [Triticum aestivum]
MLLHPCPPSSPTSGMENPPLRLSASPGPLAGAAGCTQYLPSMPLQLAAAKSIALSRSSGHLHGCTPTVRSIDPTDRSSYTSRRPTSSAKSRKTVPPRCRSPSVSLFVSHSELKSSVI